MNTRLLLGLFIIFAFSCGRKEIHSKNHGKSKRGKKRDYSVIDCDSLYHDFLTIDLKESMFESFSSVRPYNALKSHYECKEFKTPGCCGDYLERLKEFEYVSDEDGVILAQKEIDEFGTIDSCFLLDYDLNLIKSFRFISHFRNDIAFVQIDSSESNEFEDFYFREDGQMKLNSYFHYRLINREGEFIDDERYHDMYFYENSYLKVKKTLYHGVLDSTGRVSVPIKYHGFGFSRFGLLPANLSGKWGLIDFENNIVEPFNFTYDEVELILESYEFKPR